MILADIVPGTPATIHYPHDSIAAVVVKRTPKRVTIARVETGESFRVDGGSGDTPPIVEQYGDVARPIAGTEIVYTLTVRGGRVRGTRQGAAPVTFGASVSRTNYQNW